MTFKNWHEYFISNQDHFAQIDIQDCSSISNAEIEIITKSIQQFQKGENSEGKNLIKYASAFDQPFYPETIKLFIKEEQRHSSALGKFMKVNGIKKINEHWVDNVFRKLRNLAALENSLIVLLTAEIIAAVYYKFLKTSTKSRVLKEICTQILSDEQMHINFQCFTMKNFFDRRNRFGKLFVRTFHKVLMTGTAITVWIFHKEIFKVNGIGFLTFYNEVFEEYYRADQMIRGKSQIEIRNSTIDYKDALGNYKLQIVSY